MKLDYCLLFRPLNSASNFSNQLAENLHFYEPTSVSLKGIEFTNSISNIVANIDRLILFDFNFHFPPNKPPNLSPEDRYGKYYNIGLRTSFYSDPAKICRKLNAKVKGTRISRITQKIFKYDKNTNKFTISVADLDISLIIRRNLITIFGLADSSTYQSEYVVLGLSKTKDFYLKNGVKRFFLQEDDRRWLTDNLTGGEAAFQANLNLHSVISVELDILSSELYGSGYSKILRTFYLEPEIKFGQRIYKEFVSQAYFKLQQTTLSSISVRLLDYLGDQISISRGNVKVFLAFRPQRLVY